MVQLQCFSNRGKHAHRETDSVCVYLRTLERKRKRKRKIVDVQRKYTHFLSFYLFILLL